MKKLIPALAVIAGITSCLQAEEASITTTLGYESEYIFRGQHMADHYMSPALDVSYGRYYGGVWAALPFDSVYADEIDFYAGLTNDLSDTAKLDLGFTYYTYSGAGDATFELYSGVSFEMPLSPALYVFYDFDLKVGTVEVNFGKNFEFNDQNSVEVGMHLGWVEPDQDKAYGYYGVSLTYNLALTDDISLNLGTNYYANSESMIDNNSNHEFTFAASVTTGF